MNARKFAAPLFALALGLSLSAFAGAAADAPAADAPKAAEKACCPHHAGAGESAGMHCDHAKMKAEGDKGAACCAQHAKMHPEGASAEGKAACPHHAGTMKGEAGADGKACCAQHAAMHKDGDAAGCCCCGAGEACPHHPAAEAPAKS
jgi:hypothetical protein